MIRKCFKCDIEMSNVWETEGSLNFQPNNGVYFATVGNYGSTFVDGLDRYGNRIEIYICDKCLRDKQAEIDVYNGDSIVCQLKDFDWDTGRKIGDAQDWDIYNEGYNAGEKGSNLKDNPYNPNTNGYSHAMWKKGITDYAVWKILGKENSGVDWV